MFSLRILIVLLLLLGTADACSCMQSIPEQIYCRSQFVSTVSVKQVIVKPFRLVYNVEHLQIFKQPANSTLPTKISTPSQSATCGVRLTVGKDVLLAGDFERGRLSISSCAMIDAEFDTSKFKGFTCKSSPAVDPLSNIAAANWLPPIPSDRVQTKSPPIPNSRIQTKTAIRRC
ncbi:hypothetical protein PRIPAC_83300 [Pristionchus pacificus]|uniref:Uncharacterized protein n=1 Tax=Pristionchus pacificus TaxID=54126 RepID=A0A2A6BTQ8_PRIPA|nr:hypothetical protein PRIPAC_83300 [Pristionchus pacificus]|eukprot:PDM69275.1 hypothetical protein PRIPAC_47577 [Pristionchus pacificus]